jgi:phosphatidylinositol alpha-1,6-mannosyltransferase
LARDSGVSDRIPRAVGLESLAEIYRSADLFVMPSTGEGFGVSFWNRWPWHPALGLDVAGARDALGDGELGTAVSENEVSSAIARLLDEPKPDGASLAGTVHSRFGREGFKAVASSAVNRLTETP